MSTILQSKDAQLLAIVRMEYVKLSRDMTRLRSLRESAVTIMIPALDDLIRRLEKRHRRKTR